MQHSRSPLSPQMYLRSIFSSKAVARGEIVRRKKRDIERFVGMDLFLNEVHRRGYQVAENSGNFVIFCNREPVRWVTHSLSECGPKSFEDFGT